MASNEELLEQYKRNNEMLDHIAKAQYLQYITIQKQMERQTPTSTKWGSYGFNPTNNSGVLATWRQVLPRNKRRKRVRFVSTNFTFYFMDNETQIDITSLIALNKNGYTGAQPFSAVTFGSGNEHVIEGTGPVYVASLTGSGSVVECASTINWVEEIFSDIDANPFGQEHAPHGNAGMVQRLNAGAMRLDGVEDAHFTREGVR